MKRNGTGLPRPLKLRRQTEKMLKTSSSLKKMSATDIRNLLEDLQVYQVELENQNKKLMRKKGDGVFHGQVESIAVQEKDENASGEMNMVVVDISEREKAEKALRESELRYRTLFRESREARSVAKKGKIVEVNPKWLELHGYENETEVVGRDVLEFIYEDDRKILEDRRKRWPEKLEAVYELRDIRRDGSIVNVEVYSSRILLEGETAILATIHDISDRKRIQEQRRQMQRLESLATLSGGIAHQFNNALSSITMHTELLEMDFSDNERVMRCVKPMKRAAGRMVSLTDQFLAYSLGGRYHRKPLNIDNVVESVISSIRRTFPDSIHLILNLAPGTPKVAGDPKQMEMLVSAVIENAIEAVENRGCIWISSEKLVLESGFEHKYPDLKPGRYACFTVKDDGKGMDSKTLDQIYEPFFTTHFVGRGLGMSAAYGIVKNHDGFISIDSKLGEGTHVCIYLPALENDRVVA